jgi:hypothetical protein
MAPSAPVAADPLPIVSSLTATGNVDTVYRDVYLDRARTLLGGVLSRDDFRRIERQRAELAELPLTIARAMDKGDWPLVKELSGRAQALRRTAESQRGAMEAAREVYVVTDVKLDPFSPGLQRFARVPAKDLPALRTRTIEQLGELERADSPWRDFYAARRAAFQALSVTASQQPAAEVAAASAGDAREAAVNALKTGDMGALEKLADAMVRAARVEPGGRTARGPAAPSAPAPGQPAVELLVSHTGETLAGARRLGLAPRRLESRVEVAALRRYAWNPLFADESGRIETTQVPLPTGTPDAFRQRLEMLMIHPLVNSGGARHLPTLVAEDVLVEDFPDPGERDQPAPSALLAALGLASRRGLARTAIEQALLDRGARVLETDLGLDPRAFRLVCIPPDVHLRLGDAEGWGRQPLWTHLDGYLVMADGRLRALAGGDVRFGGLYDLLGHNREYESERLFVRFAVVRRERMVAW